MPLQIPSSALEFDASSKFTVSFVFGCDSFSSVIGFSFFVPSSMIGGFINVGVIVVENPVGISAVGYNS